LFSPVVAKGITDNASRFVGKKTNLVNVAITRAKDSLYVVGDFTMLSKRQDILGDLAKYAQVIETLRDQNRSDYSPCELYMFTLMCAEGWQPDVQVNVGDARVDFVLGCEDGGKLAIETDGREFHEPGNQKDAARDAFLQARGYRVMRIPCQDVFQKPTDTINSIREIKDKAD
jgi:very-short-patch-repair endonuclease